MFGPALNVYILLLFESILRFFHIHKRITLICSAFLFWKNTEKIAETIDTC